MENLDKIFLTQRFISDYLQKQFSDKINAFEWSQNCDKEIYCLTIYSGDKYYKLSFSEIELIENIGVEAGQEKLIKKIDEFLNKVMNSKAKIEKLLFNKICRRYTLSTILFIVVAVGIVLYLLSKCNIWFDFPNKWFLYITIGGIILLFISLGRLAYKERQVKRDILNQGPLLLKDQEVIYPTQQGELYFIKNLQRDITYYFMLIFGALFAVNRIKNLKVSIKIILFLIAFLAFDYGIYFLVQVQFHLRDTRMGIAKTKYFEDRYKTKKEYIAQRAKDSNFWRDFRFFIPVLVIAIIGFSMVVFSLWNDLWYCFNRMLSHVIK